MTADRWPVVEFVTIDETARGGSAAARWMAIRDPEDGTWFGVEAVPTGRRCSRNRYDRLADLTRDLAAGAVEAM